MGREFWNTPKTKLSQPVSSVILIPQFSTLKLVSCYQAPSSSSSPGMIMNMDILIESSILSNLWPQRMETKRSAFKMRIRKKKHLTKSLIHLSDLKENIYTAG